MKQSHLVEVFNDIDRNAENFLDQLKRVAAQPSVSAQNLGVKECGELVRQMMQDSGLNVRVIPVNGGSPVVFGELKSEGAKETILLYSHYDVQPPEPLEEWVSEPFKPEVREGRLYARGVADDKGILVGRLMAIRAIRDTVGNLPVNLKFVTEGEEEIGSVHLHEFVRRNKELLKADAILWEGGDRDPKGRPEIYLGMKGLLYVELRSKTASVDQHSSLAPILANPAWRVVWALNTLKDRNEKILIDGFYDKVLKPTTKDLKMLEEIPFEEKDIRDTFGVKGFLKGAKGTQLKKTLYFSPTCTVCGFDSGYKGPGSKTVNPKEARVKIDFRLVPEQRTDEILAKLKRHLKKHNFSDIEVVKIDGEEPARAPMDSKILAVTVETAKLVYNLKPVIEPMLYASGPMASFVNELKIPLSSGECVARLDSKIHAPNENIRIEDYILGIKHVAAILLSYLPIHTKA